MNKGKETAGPNRGKYPTVLRAISEARREKIEDGLRQFAVEHPGALGEAADSMADRFVWPGEPWSLDNKKREMYEFTVAEDAIIRVAIANAT